MNRLILGIAAAATMAAALPALANAQPIDRREVRQEARIAQGERSGELTPREAHRLQHREFRLNRHEARMRYRNGGFLTAHDRHVLARQENRDSRAIYRLKHNDRVAY